jgi:hypothetical protein
MKSKFAILEKLNFWEFVNSLIMRVKANPSRNTNICSGPVKKLFLLTVALLAASVLGCNGPVSGQPKLHIPYGMSSTNLRAAPASSAGLPSDPHTDSSRDTNESFRATVVGTNANTNLVAFIQLASDDDVAQEFGSTFSRCFYVGEVAVENNGDDVFLAYSSSLQVNVAYYVSERDWAKSEELRRLLIKRFRKEYILNARRPSTYSDILAIFEYQRQANPTQQAINIAKSIGEIAAGATIFIGGPLYPKAVAFTTGIVTPELEKRLLWDVLMHAKNLETRSFKEVEEIPAHSSIHRLVFFPKRGIPGVLDGFLVYVSSFSHIQGVRVSGSFIKKNGSASSATLRTE